jgi:hypothetical protein
MVPAIAAMASNLVRMLSSFAMTARQPCRRTTTDQFILRNIVPKKRDATYAAISDSFCARRNR